MICYLVIWGNPALNHPGKINVWPFKTSLTLLVILNYSFANFHGFKSSDPFLCMYHQGGLQVPFLQPSAFPPPDFYS